MSDDPCLDVALVFSHQLSGPFFCANTIPDLFDIVNKEMFASRIVLTTGIGENLLASNKFHGPLETVELKNKGLNLFSLIFPFRILIEEQEQPGIGDIHRVLIFVLQFKDEEKTRILKNMGFLEKEIRKFILKQDLSFLKSNEPDCEGKGVELVSSIKNRINYVLRLREKGAEMGNTLFHLGNLPKVPEEIKPLIGILIKNPNGVSLNELKNAKPEFITDEKLDELLEELELMGLVTIESIDSEKKVIPH